MASYNNAVAWIARNDDCSDMARQMNDGEDIIPSVTVCLVADLWNKPQDDVARHVVRTWKRIYPNAS